MFWLQDRISRFYDFSITHEIDYNIMHILYHSYIFCKLRITHNRNNEFIYLSYATR
jgi:hypothetical protein